MSERIEMTGRDSRKINTAAWQARADELLRRMVEEGHDRDTYATILREAFGDITFRDDEQRSWRHDGSGWWRWDDPRWVQPAPPPELHLATVAFDVEDEVTEAEATALDDDQAPVPPDVAWAPPSASLPASRPYHRTHTVPDTGMWSWATPDATTEAAALLDPRLDVELLNQRDDGWARVRCSNGWEAWVDGGALSVAGAG